MLLNVRYLDESWEGWDPEELTVEEIVRIEEETGFARIMGPDSLLLKAWNCEALAVQALIWWLRGGTGHAKNITGLKPMKLQVESVPDPKELSEESETEPASS